MCTLQVNHNGTARGLAAAVLIVFLTAPVPARSDSGESTAWWEQQKIRYFWSQWNRYKSEIKQDVRGERHHHGPSILNPAKYLKHTEGLINSLEQVGATVFVRYRPGYLSGPMYEENQARLAREHGMRYFGIIYLHTFAAEAKRLCPDRRISVNQEGKPYGHEVYGLLPCPVYRPAYEKWLLEPTLHAARSGLVDGLHMDWEPYGVRSEARLCYCDHCFKTFLANQSETLDAPVPKDHRHAWLIKREHLEEFEALFAKRRAEMFRKFAQQVRKIKPGFIFAGYDMLPWAPEIAPGLHDPNAPFFHIDNRHMSEAHGRSWWQSLHTLCKKAGYVRIAGINGHTLFGSQPSSEASAVQMLYDMAISSDGFWVWLEQEFTPDTWRTFWIANRRIQTTEQKVGDFLLHGETDTRFATVVEWSGDPSFNDKIIKQSFHLNGRHLVQVNNVHTDWPVRLRLRFPRLPADSKWTVTDPMAEAHYVREGRRAIWSSRHLHKGIVVSLAKRSELFLILTPTSEEENVAKGAVLGAVLFSDEGEMMPPHPSGEAFSASAKPDVGKEQLAVTATERMGYDGSDSWSLGNAIHTVDVNGGEMKRLRQVKGYLWSPTWSPDGRNIAFVHDSNGRGQIYALDTDHAGSNWTYEHSSAIPPTLPDGSRWVNLSSNDHCDRDPIWSPDGSRIAFLSDRDGDWNIYVMDTAGRNQHPLTNSPGRDSQPVWSPDGRQIAFCRDVGSDVDVLVINADGTGERVVVQHLGDQWDPAWSPDGGRIACVGVDSPNLNALLVADLGTGKIKKILKMLSIKGPQWSPDGKMLAGVHGGNRTPDETGIFLVDSDSYAAGFNVWGLMGGLKDECKLVAAPSIRSYSAEPQSGNARTSWYSKGGGSPRWVVKTFSAVRWSTDGTHLAFSSDMSDDGYFYVYVVPSAGGEPARLDKTRSAWPQQISWRPR